MCVSYCNTTLLSYHLNNSNLSSVSSYKYVGVGISSDSSLKMHVDHIITLIACWVICVTIFTFLLVLKNYFFTNL